LWKNMLQGEIINSKTHFRMPTKLGQYFKTVWPHKNRTEILLQYDNAMLQTREAITNFAWAVLPHPQSSNLKFPPIQSPEECNLQHKVGDWWWCNSHSKNSAIWAEHSMVPTRHTHTCSVLTQGHRFETLCKKQAVDLFITCNFCSLWINIYWEKNNRHYFLGSFWTIWLKTVQWFWCHFLQANIVTLGTSKTFQMHLKPIVNLMVIMPSYHAVFMFTWWWTSIPTAITTHRQTGYNVISCEWCNLSSSLHTKQTGTTHETSSMMVWGPVTIHTDWYLSPFGSPKQKKMAKNYGSR
jgi:hypothetical protein